MKIFLSHRSRDKALVREFKEMLPGFLAAWLDEETLCWGDSLEKQLKFAIQSEVDFLIIFLDCGTLESSWIRKELDWALERERELERTFVLPILLEDIAAEMLPSGFLDRIHLRLADFTHASVESLAKQASLGLFQLVAKSYSSLQDLSSLRHFMTSTTTQQEKLLMYIANHEDVTQTDIEQAMDYSNASSELFYRLENLVLQGFLWKYTNETLGPYLYEVTGKFRSRIKNA